MKHKVGDLVLFKTQYISDFKLLGIITNVEKKRYVKYTIHWFETDGSLYNTGFNTADVTRYKKNFIELMEEKNAAVPSGHLYKI